MHKNFKESFLSRALVDSSRLIIMDWSEKAGCTVMIKMFLSNMGLLEEALAYNPWVHNYRIDILIPQQKELVNKINLDHYFKFKVVRNPFARAVSAYLHLMDNQNTGFQHFIRQMVHILNTDSTDFTFLQFIQYLQTLDLTNCNDHFSMQRKPYEGYIDFEFHCKIEQVNEDIEIINNLTHGGLSIPERNSPHHHRITSESVYSAYDIPYSQLRSIPEYKYFYNEKIEELITTMYHDDFIAYKYPKQID